MIGECYCQIEKCTDHESFISPRGFSSFDFSTFVRVARTGSTRLLLKMKHSCLKGLRCIAEKTRTAINLASAATAAAERAAGRGADDGLGAALPEAELGMTMV